MVKSPLTGARRVVNCGGLQTTDMSASRIDTSSAFQTFIVEAGRTTINLAQDAVRIRRNGIEFRCPTPIPVWAEMTVTLESVGEGKRVNCTGIVVACEGNRHRGYSVSMLFMNLSRQSQERLNSLAYAQLP
jgi:PilZ domain